MTFEEIETHAKKLLAVAYKDTNAADVAWHWMNECERTHWRLLAKDDLTQQQGETQ